MVPCMLDYDCGRACESFYNKRLAQSH